MLALHASRAMLTDSRWAAHPGRLPRSCRSAPPEGSP